MCIRDRSAAHIVYNLGRAALLNPNCELHVGGFQRELVFVDFEKQGKGIRIPIPPG